MISDQPYRLAREWALGDPDPNTRVELETLIDARDELASTPCRKQSASHELRRATTCPPLEGEAQVQLQCDACGCVLGLGERPHMAWVKRQAGVGAVRRVRGRVAGRPASRCGIHRDTQEAVALHVRSEP